MMMLAMRMLMVDGGGYDQADLKSLLLFGRPLVGAEASVADETLFSLDLSGYFDSLIKAPFDYDLTVGPTSDLRLDIETTIRFGRKLRLGIRAVQESAESTRVRAGFEYQIGDSVSLEASLNRNTGEQNSIPDAYEARVNFEIFRD